MAAISSYFRVSENVEIEGSPLEIADKQIRFLQKSLLEDCRFLKMDDFRHEEFGLLQASVFLFFIHTPIIILVISADNVDENNIDKMKRALWGHANRLFKGNIEGLERFSCQLGSESDQSIIPLCLRGNKTPISVNRNEGRLSNLILDAKGFARINRNHRSEAQYLRYRLLYSLMMAYQIRFENWMADLTSLVKNEKYHALTELRRDCLLFNALYYFNNPVRFGSIELRYVWEDLVGFHKLSEWQREFARQLQGVEEMESARLKEVEEAKQHRQNLKLTRFGILMTVIGVVITLLSILDVTPEKFPQFVNAWSGIFGS